MFSGHGFLPRPSARTTTLSPQAIVSSVVTRRPPKSRLLMRRSATKLSLRSSRSGKHLPRGEATPQRSSASVDCVARRHEARVDACRARRVADFIVVAFGPADSTRYRVGHGGRGRCECAERAIPSQPRGVSGQTPRAAASAYLGASAFSDSGRRGHGQVANEFGSLGGGPRSGGSPSAPSTEILSEPQSIDDPQAVDLDHGQSERRLIVRRCRYLAHRRGDALRARSMHRYGSSLDLSRQFSRTFRLSCKRMGSTSSTRWSFPTNRWGGRQRSHPEQTMSFLRRPGGPRGPL